MDDYSYTGLTLIETEAERQLREVTAEVEARRRYYRNFGRMCEANRSRSREANTGGFANKVKTPEEKPERKFGAFDI